MELEPRSEIVRLKMTVIVLIMQQQTPAADAVLFK